MKKLLVVGLSVLACSAALADGQGRGQLPSAGQWQGQQGQGRGPVQGPVQFPTQGGDQGRGGDPVQACLMDLHRTQSELQICESSRTDPRVLEQLRSENDQLRRDNLALRAQIDQMNRDRQIPRDPRDQGRGQSLGFFSYAGCKNFQGNTDLKFIASGEGRGQLESDTTAEQKVAQTYTCNFGIKVEKSEEIRTTQLASYCVAGCIDFQGNVDQKFIQTGRGRNKTEAEFNALKATGNAFNCNFGIKIQACQ